LKNGIKTQVSGYKTINIIQQFFFINLSTEQWGYINTKCGKHKFWASLHRSQ